MTLDQRQVESTPQDALAPRQRRWPVLLVALVLATAALLKLAGLGVQTVSSLSILTDPSIELAIIEVEFALAIWVWWGTNPIGSWLSAVALFLVFAGVTFYQAFEGQASCGCFGYMRVAPGQALLIDIACLGLLVAGRPYLRSLFTTPRSVLVQQLMPVAKSTVGLVLVFGILTGTAYGLYGSPARALAILRGETLTLYPRVVDIGAITAGESREMIVEARNWSDKPITIVGGTADCSCHIANELPLDIQPGEATLLRFHFALKTSPGRFARMAWVYIDDERLQILPFEITGLIQNRELK